MHIKYVGSEELGTTKINSNTKVVVLSGAVVVASTAIDDYPRLNSMYIDSIGYEIGRTLLYAYASHDIEIVGESGSIINGGGFGCRVDERAGAHPGLIRFVNCKNITLKNLALVDSPCWAVQFMNCENIVVENVSIVSKWGGCNNGIDLISCKNVRINNCVLDTGDACVSIKTITELPCENVLIENCIMSSEFSALKLGTESVGDFRDIIFRNCTIRRAECCAIEIVPTDGGSVDGLTVENIDIKSATGPIFVANGTRNASFISGITSKTQSSISNVILKNIKADVHISESQLYGDGRGDCVFLSGTKNKKLKNLTIEDCTFKMPGGKVKDKAYVMQELKDEYPEYYILGVAPASGIYVRHADGVSLKNVTIEIKEDDNRKKVVFDDTINYVVE